MEDEDEDAFGGRSLGVRRIYKRRYIYTRPTWRSYETNSTSLASLIRWLYFQLTIGDRFKRNHGLSEVRRRRLVVRHIVVRHTRSRLH